MKEAQPTQQFVDVEEIRDNVVLLKNGGLRRIIIVSGINFELKSQEEQGIITYTYQGFLNTLDFSVQFVVHSRKLNIDAYLQKLKERQNEEPNELLKNQIEEYVEFVRSFIEMNAVMAKTFFAVVPYDPIVLPTGGKKLLDIFKFGGKSKAAPLEESLEQKITQLEQRTDQVINGLSQIGLRAVVLNKEELIELFYNLYNPQAVEKKELQIAKEST